MDERDKRRVGEEIEPGGRPKAPGRLALLQRFINSSNHDFPPEWDRIGTGKRAQAWLRRTGLVAPGARVSNTDAARLRELREAIRALVVANRGGRPPAAALQVVRARGAEVRVAIDDAGRTILDPTRSGIDGAATALLAVLHEAQISGDWSRMRACRTCEYAFFDRSKNRSAAWCDMAICGNRTKNRTYYRRHRTSTG